MFYFKKQQKYIAKQNILIRTMSGGNGVNNKLTYVYLDDKDKFYPALSFQHDMVDYVYGTGLNPVKSKVAENFSNPHHIYALLYLIGELQHIFLVNLTTNTVKLGVFSVTNLSGKTYDEVSKIIKLPELSVMVSKYPDILKYLKHVIERKKKDPSDGQITVV